MHVIAGFFIIYYRGLQIDIVKTVIVNGLLYGGICLSVVAVGLVARWSAAAKRRDLNRTLGMKAPPTGVGPAQRPVPPPVQDREDW